MAVDRDRQSSAEVHRAKPGDALVNVERIVAESDVEGRTMKADLWLADAREKLQRS